jgi:hypothetical protein
LTDLETVANLGSDAIPGFLQCKGQMVWSEFGEDAMSNTKAKKATAKGGKQSAKTLPNGKENGTGHTKVQKAKTSQSSKHDQILTLLRRPQGASLIEMQKTSGWQPHSVRGFLSGTVKHKLGLQLSSVKNSDGERRYSVAG